MSATYTIRFRGSAGMAIYATFFLSRPDELSAGFPGWKPPLAEPVTRKIVDPFTKKPRTIATVAPNWDDVDPDDLPVPEFRVVYQEYLEQRIPPFVQSKPHWCGKGLTNIEVETLVAATNANDSKLKQPLFAHPCFNAMLEELPPEFPGILAELNATQRSHVAENWAATMSTPEYTHSISGNRVQDDWTAEEALELLSRLVNLAHQQSKGDRMYLLNEF